MVTLPNAPITEYDMHDVCLLAAEELAGETPGNSGQMELARRLEDISHAVIYANFSVQFDRTNRLYAFFREQTAAGDSWSKMQFGVAVIRDRLRATIRDEDERLDLFRLCAKLFDVTI